MDEATKREGGWKRREGKRNATNFVGVVSTMEFERGGGERAVSRQSGPIKEKASILVRQWNAPCSRRTTRFLSVPYTSLVSLMER